MTSETGLRRMWNQVRAVINPLAHHTKLAVIGDGGGWVLDAEAGQIARIMSTAGFDAFESRRPWPMQVAFYASRTAALNQLSWSRRAGISVCFPYFHGYPGQGDATFDQTYRLLASRHHDVARIQVTHTRMRDVLLETGIAPDKLRTIVIGIDASAFSVPTPERRRRARERLGIPQSAVVVGSFQKDGNGWGEGLEPKLVKGPDLLVRTLQRMRTDVPELFVLLSGPARGFVKRGLTAAGIPFVHRSLAAYEEVPELFDALDVYIVASRQEGGPKAILESMASGIPIVSSRVGQATELIHQGENGWLVDVGDVEASAQRAIQSISDSDWRGAYAGLARATAERHDYLAQTPQWIEFFRGILAPATGRSAS